MIAPAAMNGSASTTWRKLRSSSEPSSQNAISSTTNGLLDRFMTSAVAAPARLESASPAKIRINSPALRPAIVSKANTELNAPITAATGSAQDRTSASPNAITSTAPNAADCGAPNNEGEANGLRSKPCRAAPERPSMPPIANARIVRGSRISRTITCCTSLPPPNRASSTLTGDSRTGPTPSEISTSITTRATSPTITLARRRAATSAPAITF